MKKQLGFSLVEGVVIIAVLAIIGGVAYTAFTHFTAPQSVQTAMGQTPSSSPTAITTQKDLASADQSLSDLSLDDTDSSQLDGATSF